MTAAIVTPLAGYLRAIKEFSEPKSEPRPGSPSRRPESPTGKTLSLEGDTSEWVRCWAGRRGQGKLVADAEAAADQGPTRSLSPLRYPLAPAGEAVPRVGDWRGRRLAAVVGRLSGTHRRHTPR
jgi:hypothetical protein